MKLVFLLLSVLALSSCNRGDNKTSSNSAAVGAGIIGGTFSAMSDCQSNTGTVAIAYQNQTYPFSAQNVYSGSSYTLTGLQNGTYTLYAKAGTCSINGAVQAPGNYNICLGSSCGYSGSSAGYYKPAGGTISSKASADVFAAMASMPPCQWNVYGCVGTMYSGSGSALIAESQIRFVVKKENNFVLSLDFSSGNNSVSSSPALSEAGWSVKVSADGSVSEKGSPAIPSLSYGAQVDQNVLQMNDGFCDKRENLVSRMSDYMKLSGFNDASQADFSQRWAQRMPSNANFCVYPQGEEQIAKTVNYKTSASLQARRLWFLIVPTQDSAMKKALSGNSKIAAFGKKPALDAFKEAKKAPKTRSIANDPDVVAEEVGIGFLIEH